MTRRILAAAAVVVLGAVVAFPIMGVAVDQAATEAGAASSAGSFTSGRLTFVPDGPCVLFDTRQSQGGKLSAGETRGFDVDGGNLSAQGGAQFGCVGPFPLPVPTIEAVALNLVAISPDGGGNLKAWPAAQAEASGGIVNYQALSPPMNNSNAFPIEIATDGAGKEIKVKANGAAVHVRGIYLGYYADAGDVFSPVWHDHLASQGTSATTTLTSSSYVEIASVEITLPEGCGGITNVSEWNVLVTASAHVVRNQKDGAASYDAVVVGLERGSATSAVADSERVSFHPDSIDLINPISTQWLFGGVGAGTSRFYLNGRIDTVLGVGLTNSMIARNAVVDVLVLGYECAPLIVTTSLPFGS